MKPFLQKLGLLGLSFMLVSPIAIAPALPAMLSYYQKLGYGAGQVELLISLSSLTILTILLLTPYISRFLNDTVAIISGFLMIALGGCLPVFTQAYALLFLAHILLGCGIGLINAHAITSISHYYRGEERSKLLGWRGATEVLGSALLTFLAGQWMTTHWSRAYGIFSIALPLLAFYLLFVPKKGSEQKENTAEKPLPLTRKQLLYLLGMAGYACSLILINTATTMRIPLVIEGLGIGTAQDSSLILSLMMLMGILAGTGFNRILKGLKSAFLPTIPLIFGLAMLMLWISNQFWSIGIGALASGFVYSLGVTYVFHAVSEQFPKNQLKTATTLVLLGCNIGGAGAAFVLRAIALYHPDLRFPYLVFAGISLGISAVLVLKPKDKTTPF